jgi:hypothetical protein
MHSAVSAVCPRKLRLGLPKQVLMLGTWQHLITRCPNELYEELSFIISFSDFAYINQKRKQKGKNLDVEGKVGAYIRSDAINR